MNTTTPTTAPTSTISDLRKAPTAWKVAAVLAALGWFLKVGGVTRRTVNGVVVECSGVDLGPFIAAGVVLIATVAGLRQVRGTHEQRRPSATFVRGAVVVLGAAALALVLRGVIDPDGSYC